MHGAFWPFVSIPAIIGLVVSTYISNTSDYSPNDPTYQHSVKPSRVPFLVAFLTSIVLIPAFWFQLKDKIIAIKYVYTWFLIMLYTNATVELTKASTGRIRPDGSDAFSFPSGHTAVVFVNVYYGMFLILHELHKVITVSVSFTIAWCIAMTRIVDNKHFEHDVIGGIIVSGFISYIFCNWLLYQLHTTSDARPPIGEPPYKEDPSNAEYPEITV